MIKTNNSLLQTLNLIIMKTPTFLLCFVLFLFVPFTGMGQEIVLPLNSETNLIEYSELVQIDSTTTQKALYSRAKEWVAIAFKSAKDVIQMDDSENGIMILKGIIPISGGMYLADGKVDFTMKIQLKNGRYKYWITNFSHSSYKPGYSGGALENTKPACGSMSMMKKGWNQVKESTDKYAQNIVQNLKSFMTKQSIDKKVENW